MPRSSQRTAASRQDGLPQSFYKKKSIACRTCHARKVRCSGGKPCDNCTRASECVYPSRDRQIKIHQSFLDRLLEENEELRSRLSAEPAAPESLHPPQSNEEIETPPDNEGSETPHNPILQEGHWFAHIKTSDTPIWIGEISDAAFATRFRQFASSPQTSTHFPRKHYATDEMLYNLSSSTPAWPSPTRCRFLAEAALRSLCRCYHVVRRSEILSALNTVTRDGFNPPRDTIFTCKMWALFAIGELYSNRSASSNFTFPGLAYFAHASNLLRVVSERPHLDAVESMLLLSLYSLELNRRHSACTLVGSAMRLATVMGLHLNIDRAYIPDPEVREHRNRVWWTTYNFDRMWSSKIGLPVLISDDDISVDLPSEVTGPNADDFVDHEYLIAGIKLAKIAGQIIKSIYDRENKRGTFSQRVQEVLGELRGWSEELPKHLQLNQSTIPIGRVVSLNLSFNQLLILTTRPIVLVVLRDHLKAARDPGAGSAMPNSLRAIADACIRTARRSCSLLAECWMTGAFHVFDYFYTQYLFSAATVVAISSLLGTSETCNDTEVFENAVHFLEQLQQSGNFAAKEFCAHADGISLLLQAVNSPQDAESGSTGMNSDAADDSLFSFIDPQLAAVSDLALFEPSLQELLGDENLHLLSFDSPMNEGEFHGLSCVEGDPPSS